MKKTFLFSLRLIVAFSVMFISCDDNPGNNLGGNTGIPCEINIVASEGGDVQFNDYVGNSKHVYTGANVTVIAVADGGYAFLGWYIVGSSEKLVCNTASYTFAAKGDLQLVAKFGKLQDIAIGSSDGGSASFKDSEEKTMHLLPGEEVTVVATPNDGYEFVGWYVGSNLVSKDAEYIFTVSAGVNLVAEFLEILSVTVSSTKGGVAVIKDAIENIKDVLYGESITLVATPDKDYAFIGWFIGDSEEPVNIYTEYTFTVKEDIALLAKFEEPVYEAIDLGLSVKWASFNVGASRPEAYGGYYAWGETDEKDDYSWSTYKWCNGSGDTMAKYCTNSSYGTVDNKTTLDLEDDVAHVKWGGDWRMPTRAEQDELRNNCTWEWTALNGVNGYRVTGPNGNSIFLPAAGYRDGAYGIYATGDGGYYWSSSLYSSSNSYAYYLVFYDNLYDWSNYYRCRGHSVRPVSE